MLGELFFQLLQVALGQRDALSRPMSEDEWGRIFWEAKRQGIVGVMADGLDRLPREQLPPESVSADFIKFLVKIEFNYRQQCECAAELTHIFGKEGYRSSVLKGVSVAQYYPRPQHRSCGDIDLWVIPRDTSESRYHLTQWLKNHYEVPMVVWHHIDARIFDKVKTEIHIYPAWMYNPIKNRFLQHFFRQETDRQMSVDSSLGFACTTVQFDAVYSLIHTFHHLLEEGVGLRHIIDYYYVLSALPKDSYGEVLLVTDHLGLGRFVGAMMWILNKAFKLPEEELLCKANEEEGRFLLKEVLASGNFGQSRRDGKGRNTFKRWRMLLKHYPSEVLWMHPWKIWHRCWRFMHN